MRHGARVVRRPLEYRNTVRYNTSIIPVFGYWDFRYRYLKLVQTRLGHVRLDSRDSAAVNVKMRELSRQGAETQYGIDTVRYRTIPYSGIENPDTGI
jgi:hypothetical protein